MPTWGEGAPGIEIWAVVFWTVGGEACVLGEGDRSCSTGQSWGTNRDQELEGLSLKLGQTSLPCLVWVEWLITDTRFPSDEPLQGLR